jgi:hypothetical protein
MEERMGSRIRAILNVKPLLPGYYWWGGFLLYGDGLKNNCYLAK